jgi:NAD(P)-dependent dehydrogenase (short-subunit alcohol dehydrogenase family)
MQLKPIEEQVVVIMGASSGIGRGAALAFARRGAKVVVAARSAPGLDSLVMEIQRTGGEATAVKADAARFDDVRHVADTAVQTYGRLDTWVHVAGVALYATFEETNPEEFRQVIDINLNGQAYGAMAALPHLRQSGGGALIHISSVEGLRAMPYQAAYAASKHGIIGFLEALRVELQREGAPISVTNILPAAINTPFFNKARTKIGVKPQGIPPIYPPETVISAILYAAENPTRHLFAGGAGRALGIGQAIAPALMDMLIRRVAFRGQRTDEPKSANDPNNLFSPIEGYNRVTGDFTAQTISSTPRDNGQISGTMALLGGVAVGAMLALGRQSR